MSQITIYGTEHCPKCRTLKHRMDALELKYEYVDVNKDSQAVDTLTELGFNALPVLRVGEVYSLCPNAEDLAKLKKLIEED